MIRMMTVLLGLVVILAGCGGGDGTEEGAQTDQQQTAETQPEAVDEQVSIDPDSPGQRAVAFYYAMVSGDLDLHEHFHPTAMERFNEPIEDVEAQMIQMTEQALTQMGGLDSVTVVSQEIRGDTALVILNQKTGNGQEGQVRHMMLRHEGAWKIAQ